MESASAPMHAELDNQREEQKGKRNEQKGRIKSEEGARRAAYLGARWYVGHGGREYLGM